MKKNNIDIDKINFVAECIGTTRTIGGSFIWPIEYAGRWYTKYNLYRGNRSYLEDRVDLTLLEVKHYYDSLKSSEWKNLNRDILHSSIKNKTSKMKDFLDCFGTFENYVQYFHFQDFVGITSDKALMPIDIVCSDLEKNITVLLDNKQEYKTNIIKELDEVTLKKMLYNVKTLVEMRTKWIEELIKTEDLL